MLRETGTLDSGELVVLARAPAARGRRRARARPAGRLASVIVDDVHEATRAQLALRELLAGPAGDLVVARRPGGLARRRRGHGWSTRCAAPRPSSTPREAAAGSSRPAPAGEAVSAWRCANERAQAQSVAADVERLITREGVEPEAVCVLVRSVRREGQAVAVALEERGVPYRLVGAAAFFQRAEIRDVLAWLRLLADPGDAGAVVRALARPPIELRSVDIARCTQISRRRKIDMVSALVAATESPQIPPEARDRILIFLKLYRSASAALDTTRPDLYVHRLIERLGLRRQQLFAAQADVVERLLNLARFGELATAYVRRSPQADAARVRPVHRRGGRGRAARGGGGGRDRAARRAGDGDAPARGPGVRARLRARASHVGANAGRADGAPWSRSLRSCCGADRPPDDRAGARRRDAPPARHRDDACA